MEGNVTTTPSYCTAPEERRIINCLNMGHSWNYTEGNKNCLVEEGNMSVCKFVRHKSSVCKSPYFIRQIPFIIPATIPTSCVGRSAVSIRQASRGKAESNVCQTKQEGSYTSLGRTLPAKAKLWYQSLYTTQGSKRYLMYYKFTY